MEEPQDPSLKKTPKRIQFGEIEDVISIGALLRPTIAKAIGALRPNELQEFLDHLIAAEKELANSRVEFRTRFERAQERLRSLYAYAPIWRFIVGRIEECWKDAASLTVKELSVVSLLLGITLEETQIRLAKKSKRSA